MGGLICNGQDFGGHAGYYKPGLNFAHTCFHVLIVFNRQSNISGTLSNNWETNCMCKFL
jgi:hypothetical protein